MEPKVPKRWPNGGQIVPKRCKKKHANLIGCLFAAIVDFGKKRRNLLGCLFARIGDLGKPMQI